MEIWVGRFTRIPARQHHFTLVLRRVVDTNVMFWNIILLIIIREQSWYRESHARRRISFRLKQLYFYTFVGWLRGHGRISYPWEPYTQDAVAKVGGDNQR